MSNPASELGKAVDTIKLRQQYARARRAQARCPMARRESGACQRNAVAQLLSRVPALCDELDELREILAQVQLGHQDLVAAARATLTAYADGDADPFYYLRDELLARGHLATGPGDRPW